MLPNLRVARNGGTKAQASFGGLHRTEPLRIARQIAGAFHGMEFKTAIPAASDSEKTKGNSHFVTAELRMMALAQAAVLACSQAKASNLGLAGRWSEGRITP
jgi:hypothetical protein